MAQHGAPGIAARRVALMQDLQLTLGEVAPDLAVGYFGVADFQQFRGREEDVLARCRLETENDIGRPCSTFLRLLTEGLTRFCSIREMVPLVTPARLANSRCDM